MLKPQGNPLRKITSTASMSGGLLQRFEIVFDHNGDFYPGSVVSGRLFVETTSDLYCSFIAIDVFGKAETEFLKTDHKESKNFVDERIYLQGQNGDFVLKFGKVYIFDFACSLAKDSPPTFMHEKGHVILYRCNALIRRPNHPDMSKSKFFRVLPLPLTATERRTLGCALELHDSQKILLNGCWPQGKVSVNIKLARQGISQHEPISVHYDVTNKTHLTRLRTISFELLQYCQFHTENSQKRIEEQKIMLKTTQELCLLHGQTSGLKFVRLKWPKDGSEHDVPPTVVNCRFLKVYYKLFVTITSDSLFNRIAYSSVLPLVITTSPAGADKLVN